MKRNKLVSIAAITVALGVLATGCAGGSGSSKSDSKSSGGTKTVTVKAGTGANVNPGNIHQIIAKGPDEEAWLLPHGREKLSEK